MNAKEILFRCSSLGFLMVEPKLKSETISETTKVYLIDVFVSTKYGRREDIEGKFLDKGNDREQDSITLLSRVKKFYFSKNEKQLSNDFISGTPDLFTGESIENADEIIDCKTSWSANTFFRAQKELNKTYYWQLQGYCALTRATKATVAYCLVNATPESIMAEKKRLSYKPGMLDQHGNELPAYIAKCKQLEINMIYDLHGFRKELAQRELFFEFHNDIEALNNFPDIPMAERLFTFSFDRNEDDIKRLYQRIENCRLWMSQNLFKSQSELITA